MDYCAVGESSLKGVNRWQPGNQHNLLACPVCRDCCRHRSTQCAVCGACCLAAAWFWLSVFDLVDLGAFSSRLWLALVSHVLRRVTEQGRDRETSPSGFLCSEHSFV